MPRHCEYVQQIKHLKVPIEDFQTAIFDKYKTIKQYAYIIHDKDRYLEEEIKSMKSNELKKPEAERRTDFPAPGDLKEPHVHVYLNFGRSNAKFSDVAKWFNDEPQYVNRILSRKADVLEYLNHKNKPMKFQYSDDLIITNMDIKKEIEDDRKLAQMFEDMNTMLYDFAAEKMGDI